MQISVENLTVILYLLLDFIWQIRWGRKKKRPIFLIEHHSLCWDWRRERTENTGAVQTSNFQTTWRGIEQQLTFHSLLGGENIVLYQLHLYLFDKMR